MIQNAFLTVKLVRGRMFFRSFVVGTINQFPTAKDLGEIYELLARRKESEKIKVPLISFLYLRHDLFFTQGSPPL